MNSNDLNKRFDALKRQCMDVVRDLHARKLAIPAGALLAAIVAAMILLPQGSAPPPAPPTAATPTVKPAVERVAQVSLIQPSSLDEDIPLTNSTDPFTGTGGYTCTRVGSGTPKTYDCIVSDLTVRIVCTATGGAGPCADSAGGSTGGTGGTSSGGSGGGTSTGGGSTPTSGNGGGTKNPTKKKSTTSYYVVTVSIDGTTTKDVVAGDELPNSTSPLAVYAGTNDAHTKAVFISADGVTVTGVPVDSTFGSFTLSTGKTATLTDAKGAAHKLTLKSIAKVTK